MGKYKLSEEAEADLIRIHQWGTRRYGEETSRSVFQGFLRPF